MAERERRDDERERAPPASGGAPAPSSGGGGGGAPAGAPPGYVAPPEPAPGYFDPLSDARAEFAAHFERHPADRSDIMPTRDPRLQHTMAAVRAPYSVSVPPRDNPFDEHFYSHHSRVEVPIQSDFREYLHGYDDEPHDDAEISTYDRNAHIVPTIGAEMGPNARTFSCPLCLRPDVEDHDHYVTIARRPPPPGEFISRPDRVVNLNDVADMHRFVNDEVRLARAPQYRAEAGAGPSQQDLSDRHAVNNERHRRYATLMEARHYIQDAHDQLRRLHMDPRFDESNRAQAVDRAVDALTTDVRNPNLLRALSIRPRRPPAHTRVDRASILGIRRGALAGRGNLLPPIEEEDEEELPDFLDVVIKDLFKRPPDDDDEGGGGGGPAVGGPSQSAADAAAALMAGQTVIV